MFDPLSVALIMGGVKLVQKLQGSSSPSPSVKCRWGGVNAVAEASASNTTRCCNSTLCPSCIPQWRQAGGKNCVLCGTTHP